ncbi:polycomb group protein Psc-like [Daphnia carinata]|uniref:polycomb group protein Psc-like n=1 Tax=Daphnia carinata TaxID=120202 RepID=UPI00257A65FC|nr:polycomb group protein Psc-like [Daphnia carinata]
MDSKSLPLSRLQSNLTCSICQGYLIDATTITECMHTFCKSCLLQRVESGRTFCPRCGIQLQRSRLGEQLKLDHAVQALVYAAVPGLWQEEQRRRKHFVDHHPLSTSVAPPLQHPTCFSPSDPISLSLDFIPQSREEDSNLNLKGPCSPQTIGRRFFRCPAAVAVHHFQKLLSLKFELPPHYTIEIHCQGEKLASSFRLMDVAYKTGWTQEEPLRLEYKIVKNPASKATVLISGSTAEHVTQSNRCHSRTSSTEFSGKTTTGVKRSSAPPPSTPAKQQKLSISIKKAALQNNAEEVVHRSPMKSPQEHVNKKKSGRKKRKRRKTMDLIPIMEPMYPLKVKIVERMKSPEYSWPRPNGVELLVQAAELASRQNPTPPPESEKTDAPNSPPPLLPICNSDTVNNNSKPTCLEKEIAKEDTPQLTGMAEDDLEEDDKLLMVDETNLNSSNGRDSGMANDDEEDDSAGALDLSAKSSRYSPPDESSSKTQSKSVSPPFIQQRSTALHSITDSLAERQQRIQQQQRRLPTHHPEAMRNLVTLSQTAALVPPHPQQVATQRLIVASYMHQFAAAAAARAASAPLRPPKPPQPSKSLTHGLLRRPF